MSRFRRGDDAKEVSREFVATRSCDVCGKQRPTSRFGDGVKLPKGTCITCGERIKTETEQRKIELKRMKSS